VEEAVGHYEQALRLDPKNALAHACLGDALRLQGKVGEAVGHYEQALRLDPKDALTHYNLGNALQLQGKLDEAISHYEQALRLDPKLALAHNDLGLALGAKGKLDEAISHYEQALRLDPKYAYAHYNLGSALHGKGKLEEAISHYEQALRLDPKLAVAHGSLGYALQFQGKLDEAIGHYEQAVRIDPKLALAHYQLGQALLAHGRLAEARDATRRCRDLVPERDPLYTSATQQLKRCERLLALAPRLPAVLRGQDKPGGAAECFRFADLCRLTKRYAVAARLYADAFAADPELAGDPWASQRYTAACCTALAAAGQGTDAAKLDGKERARLRHQALDWLRADLASWGEQVEKSKAEERKRVQWALRHWQRDIHLAGVRDAAALAKLPEAERADWQRLWADVAALLKKAEANSEP
jgi:tetratricopeptide (TPR) repeat protein